MSLQEKFLPIHDRIVLKKETKEMKSEGGIILTKEQDEVCEELEVVAVSEGRIQEDGVLKPLQVKVGDRVVVSKFATADLKVRGDEYFIIREEDVLGVLRN